MNFPHLSKERIHALMFETVSLTQEEDSHIQGWCCSECTKTALEVVSEYVVRTSASSESN